VLLQGCPQLLNLDMSGSSVSMKVRKLLRAGLISFYLLPLFENRCLVQFTLCLTTSALLLQGMQRLNNWGKNLSGDKQ
jgi:hypothetical protein